MQGMPTTGAVQTLTNPSWSATEGAMVLAALDTNFLSSAQSNFTAGHGWTLGANWTIVAEELHHAAGDTAIAYLAKVPFGVALQLVSYTTTNVTAGSVSISLGYASGLSVSTNKTLTQGLIGRSRPTVTFTPSSDFVGDIDVVSVKNYKATAVAAGGRTVIDWVAWSADTTPAAGLVAIVDEDGLVQWSHSITSAGPGQVVFDGGFYGADGVGLGVVLVPDGTIVGKLSVGSR